MGDLVTLMVLLSVIIGTLDANNGLCVVVGDEIQDQSRDGTRDWTRYSRLDLDMPGHLCWR